MDQIEGIGELTIKPIDAVTGIIKDKVLIKKYNEELLKEEIKPGVEKSLEFKRAMVAFVDVLGFSSQNSQGEIVNILNDFAGPLLTASIEKPNLRLHLFSDNAFIAVDAVHADDLIASLRYCFGRWSWNGILVRGGIAMGSYFEYQAVHFIMANSNFKGALFSGTAVNKSVQLEKNSKSGAFLFLDKESAEFLHSRYSEPIVTIEGNHVTPWSDDKMALFWYTEVSTIRLLTWLSNDIGQNSIIKKLVNNIHHSLVQDGTGFVLTVVLACLSIPTLKPKIRKKACELIGIKELDQYPDYAERIQLFLNWVEFQSTKRIAQMDSGLPKMKVKL